MVDELQSVAIVFVLAYALGFGLWLARKAYHSQRNMRDGGEP